jgi:hypothetical protein
MANVPELGNISTYADSEEAAKKDPIELPAPAEASRTRGWKLSPQPWRKVIRALDRDG